MSTEKIKNKEKEERKYLDSFFNLSLGKNWLQENKIRLDSLQKSEEPDFLFESENNKTIGIEITKLIVPNENTKATQQLITIGNQVRTYFQNTYGFPISLIIDKYDKRKFSCKWSDHLDAAYHLGFCKIPSYQKIKGKFGDKKFYTFNNGCVWEFDDFREESYKKEALNNDYCNNCNKNDKCTEGPYALRILHNGKIKPCLIRQDNTLDLLPQGYIFYSTKER